VKNRSYQIDFIILHWC